MISKNACFVLLLFIPIRTAFAADQVAAPVPVGVAKVDITPELPIRLSGYMARPAETDRIEQRLFARALAIGSDGQKPVVLLALELIGITEEISDAIAAALHESHSIERSRLAICAAHIHTGPALSRQVPYMFAKELPAGEIARIDRYAESLREKLVRLAAMALADRKPGRIAWAQGRAGFAAQRRTITNGKWAGFGFDPAGPVDHALPVLRVLGERGEVRAILASYACHCTTLQAVDNFVHSDWAGHAAARMEAAHPGAVALVALGCGADANPNPKGSLEHVRQHGDEIAREVERLLAGPLRPIGPVTTANYRRIELELDHAVTRSELQTRLTEKHPRTRYAAAQMIAQLDAGRVLPTTAPYSVQTWCFGDELAMVFLAGEVVSEYSLRLRRELDSRRLWVNSYANDVRYYVASRRMYDEGGYEVDGAMEFYGWPTRLAIGTENRIIAVVRELVPAKFRSRAGDR